MTFEELQQLGAYLTPPKMIGVQPGGDRTLIYGYDTDRRSWHVWQEGGYLHRAVYIGSNRQPEIHESGLDLLAANMAPNKRLYPEACDFGFCLKLRELGFYFSFLTFGQINRPAGDLYWGRTF